MDKATFLKYVQNQERTTSAKASDRSHSELPMIAGIVAALIVIAVLVGTVARGFHSPRQQVAEDHPVQVITTDKAPVSVSDITYLKNHRTGLCFAKINGDHQHVAVPCLIEVENLSDLRSH